MSSSKHQALILDQFTRQAIPFNTAPTITDEGALDMLVTATAPGPADTALDVACGGGIVVCALAPHLRHARGIDLTPAMLERGRALAAGKGITNVSFDLGSAEHLPYEDSAFTRVVTRFSLHHMQDPGAVMREMRRVCTPGGRIVVADMYASEDNAKAATFNGLETLRDPSHVRCLSLSELKELFPRVGLPTPDASFYELEGEVSDLLARSFPKPGDADRIVAIFAASAEDGRLGLPVRRENKALHYAYPIAVLAASRP